MNREPIGKGEWTPGPWQRGLGNDAHSVFDSQGRLIASRCGYNDGCLIAAAPDLYAALEAAPEPLPNGPIVQLEREGYKTAAAFARAYLEWLKIRAAALAKVKS